MNKSMIKGSLLLLLTACIWGMSFVSQSKGMEYMQPFTFNGIRSLIGAMALAAYIIFMRIKKTGNAETTDRKTGEGKFTEERSGEPRTKLGKTTDWKTTAKAGIWCGIILTAASMFQQYGIQYTTVGKAGFITTLYIIFVPLAGIFFKKKAPGIVWPAAALAAVGMYLLCMTESLQLQKGDILVFVCALIFTAHIMVIDHFAPDTDGTVVSCIQFAVCGILCTAGALLFEKPDWQQVWAGAGTLLYAGVLSCGVAYTLQIVGQKSVPPAMAALILSLESVIGAIAGWAAYKAGFLAADQTLTAVQIAGCAVVFASVLMVQIPWRTRGEKRIRRRNRSSGKTV